MHRLALSLAILGAATMADAQDATLGEQVFRDHCATCHGLSAKGDGPMVSVLSVVPSDLTRLASNAGGEFPLEQVVRQIDGRDHVLAHGGPMPVFGLILQGDSGVIDAADGSPVFTTQPVVDLAEYLRTIQE